MSYLKDREIWLSNVPTGNPPAGYVWVFIQNGVFVVRDSNGLDKIMATTTGTVTNATSASYVEYSNVASKPALISGSSQVSYTGLSNIPVGIVSGSSQVTYSGLTGVPSGIVSGSAQVASFGIFATTGSNGFNGSQSITGSLTVTGQVVAQTLNVQQVTSSIVYSSGSNIFGNTLGNTQQFTGSVGVTGSLTVNGASTFSSTGTFSGIVGVGGLTEEGWVLKSNGNLKIESNTGTTVLQVNDTATGGKIWSFISSGNGNAHSIPAGTFYLRNSSDSLTALSVTSTGNLGLGVTPSAWYVSEGYKALQVGNASLFGRNSTNSELYLSSNTFDNSNGNPTYITSDFATRYYQNDGLHAWLTAPSGTAGNAISFTQAMTLDASGRLGIGSTSPQGLLQIGANALSNNTDASNAFNLKQTSTTAATGIYLERSGERRGYYMYIGGSVDSLTFARNDAGTKADVMSLTRDGRVGIGTDAPGANLHVVRANDGGSGTPGVILRTDNGANDIVRFQDGTTIVAVVKNDGSIGIGTGTSSLEARLDLRGTGNTALDSRGNLFVSDGGTATQAAGEGGQISFGAWLNGDLTKPYPLAAIKGVSESSTVNINGGALIFGTMSSATTVVERMRITSTGYTKASTNGSYRSGVDGEGHEFTNTSSSNINHFTIYNNNSSTLGAILRILGNGSTTNGTYQLIQASNGTDSGRFIVFDSGNVQNTNGSYGTIASDRRLKENIVPATPKLDDLLRLNVVNFNLIGNEEKNIGFIAQEMQEVFPSFVHQTDTRKYDEDGNLISGLEDALGLKVGMEFAILVKAIQEQQSQIESLKSRIEILEQ